MEEESHSVEQDTARRGKQGERRRWKKRYITRAGEGIGPLQLALEGFEEVRDEGGGKIVAQAAYGGGVLFKEVGDATRGLVLLTEDVVRIAEEDTLVAVFEDDRCVNGDQEARRLPGGGVVGERHDGLLGDVASEGGVGSEGVIRGEDAEAGAVCEFALDRLGDSDLGVVALGVIVEGRHSDGVKGCGQMRGGPGGVVATS